jgi:hypothetical protein
MVGRETALSGLLERFNIGCLALILPDKHPPALRVHLPRIWSKLKKNGAELSR